MSLIPFEYSGQQVRVIGRDGEPWFVLSDLCKVLELSQPNKVALRLADDMKGRNRIPTPGGSQEMTIVNEPGMYEVVIRSDKPEAALFRRWITPRSPIRHHTRGRQCLDHRPPRRMKRHHMTHNTNTLGDDCAPAAPNVTGYYFAGRYSRHAELAMYRNQLLAGLPGAIVTSRWIDCHNGELEQSYTPERLNADPAGCWRHGANDIEDLCDADVLVSFTGNGGGGKGSRHIEHGYWLAAIDMIQQLRPYAPRPRVCVVGPRENIFHCHPATEQYDTWTAFLTHELRRKP